MLSGPQRTWLAGLKTLGRVGFLDDCATIVRQETAWPSSLV
jgi:hypothetical protein